MSSERERLVQELAAEVRLGATGGVFLLQALAERSGLNLTDLQCLNLLALAGPSTAGQLAERMGLTTGAITGVINRLERAGYARRAADPSDGRRVIIRIELAALERAGVRISGPRDAALADLLAKYGDRDLTLLRDFTRLTNALIAAETAGVRAAAQASAPGDFVAPLGAATRGQLLFASGVYRLDLRAGAADALCRARFEGATPQVKVAGGQVTVRYPRRFKPFDWKQYRAEFALHPATPWAIEVRGGAIEVAADLRGLRLASFAITWGLKSLDLILPEPSGEVPIRLSGGAAAVRIVRPSGTEVRLNVRGGVGALAFDGQQLEGAAGKTRLESHGFGRATDRYDIEITGGAGAITIR